MSNYRRPARSDAPVFFTVALAHRGSDLLVREIARLRETVRVTQAERPFGIEAWVVLPDHLHCIWRVPDGDCSVRWGAIKARFTRSLFADAGDDGPGRRPACRPGLSPAIPAPPLPTELPVVQSGRYAGLKPGLRVGKRERAVWQRRFWEHHIRDAADFAAHLRYCWFNPVKHGLVARPEDWPYSSVHRDITAGRYDPAAWV